MSYTITTDKFDALYKKLKPKGVTLTALLAKACGVALASHPLLYACAPSAPRTLPYHLGRPVVVFSSFFQKTLMCMSVNCLPSIPKTIIRVQIVQGPVDCACAAKNKAPLTELRFVHS